MSKRLLIWGAVVSLVGLFALVQMGIAQPAKENPVEQKAKEGKPPIEKELQTLLRVFGNGEVAIFSKDHGPYEGTIAGKVDVFGSRFLQITDKRGKPCLLRTDSILSIRQN